VENRKEDEKKATWSTITHKPEKSFTKKPHDKAKPSDKGLGTRITTGTKVWGGRDRVRSEDKQFEDKPTKSENTLGKAKRARAQQDQEDFFFFFETHYSYAVLTENYDMPLGNPRGFKGTQVNLEDPVARRKQAKYKETGPPPPPPSFRPPEQKRLVADS